MEVKGKAMAMTLFERYMLLNMLGYIDTCKDLETAEPYAGDDPQYARGIRTAYGEIARSMEVMLRNSYSPQAYRAGRDAIDKRNKRHQKLIDVDTKFPKSN